MIEHDPIVLAKQVASLDVLSGGRFVFGVGAGWNKHEMRNHGTDPATRHGDMRERVEAMRAIWTSDEAEYHGKHVDFDPIWQWPKPATPPPVYIGGNGPRVLDRVLRYGDGWMPNMKEIETLRAADRRAARAGRQGRPGHLLRRDARDPGHAARGRRRPRADRARERPRGRRAGLDTLTLSEENACGSTRPARAPTRAGWT